MLDDDERAPVAVVNEQFARTFWPGDDAIGKRLNLVDQPQRPLVVVGVVSNVVHDTTRQKRDPTVYLPYRQRPLANIWVTVRTRATPMSLATPFRQAVAGVDPNLPIGMGPFLVDDRLAGLGNYWIAANNAVLLSMFAVIALLLASIGLYAVVAHSVSQHTYEIGIRIAIGARPGDVLALVMRQGMLPLGIGLVVGLAASLGLNRLLTSQLVNVSPADPAMLLLSSVVLLLAATAGCLMPARRAMRIDPVVVLRTS
jgi:putative ABC transport system permease protein